MLKLSIFFLFGWCNHFTIYLNIFFILTFQIVSKWRVKSFSWNYLCWLLCNETKLRKIEYLFYEVKEKIWNVCVYRLVKYGNIENKWIFRKKRTATNKKISLLCNERRCYETKQVKSEIHSQVVSKVCYFLSLFVFCTHKSSLCPVNNFCFHLLSFILDQSVKRSYSQV